MAEDLETEVFAWQVNNHTDEEGAINEFPTHPRGLSDHAISHRDCMAMLRCVLE